MFYTVIGYYWRDILFYFNLTFTNRRFKSATCGTPTEYSFGKQMKRKYSLVGADTVENGLITINISIIEKCYELKSSLTGLISANYDITQKAVSLFLSFFGEKGHKPCWMAFSAFMVELGSLLFSLLHFSSGKYHYGAKLEDAACRVIVVIVMDTANFPVSHQPPHKRNWK